jgi:prepilin-type N-terminal cleavage/methylation domain-containing protein/prepilin-type processing-associated H-X9-DG protein
MPNRSRFAFTLIELLVVISIIAVLIGVLIPTLSSAREAGRSVICLSNQREIFGAITRYAIDHKDVHHAKRQNYGARFVRINTTGGYTSNNLRLLRPYINDFTTDPGSSTDYAYWGSIYDSYFDISIDPTWYVSRMPWRSADAPPFPGWKFWRCPSAKTMDPYPYGPFNPDNLYQTYGFNGVESYKDAAGVTKTAQGWWRKRYVPAYGRTVSVAARLSDILQPSGLIFFQDAFEHMLDANGDTLNDLTQYNPDIDAGSIPFLKWQKEYFRHNAGSNVAWGDGHVRSVGRVQQNSSLPWYNGVGGK